MKMQQDEMVVIGLAGLAVLLVLKSTGAQLPGAAAARSAAGSFAQSIWNPFKPSTGESYDQADPGKFINTRDLVNGTIHELATNEQPGTDSIFMATETMTGRDLSDPMDGFYNPRAYW